MIAIIILGIIQGISEFLPISSSAHLIIFRDLFSFGKDVIDTEFALSFDIALHFGTALAILIFFFRDFWNMVTRGITKGMKDSEGKMLWYIIIATIPAAIVGVLFEDIIEDILRTKYFLIALALIFVGIILYLVDKKMPNNKVMNDLTIKEAFIIGCSQIFALIPGFSRSGTTIIAGRILKLDRENAAKFSFYLSAPVVIGAVVLQLLKCDLTIIVNNAGIFFLGMLISFVTGIICIKTLLQFLKHYDFKMFMLYRLIFGIFVIIYLLV